MTGARRGHVAAVAFLTAAVTLLVAACGPFAGRDAVGTALADAGLPRDLPRHLDQLESLDLPKGIEDLGWLPDHLGGLSIDRVGPDGLARLPRGLLRLEVRGSSHLASLEGLPPGLEKLSLAPYSSVSRLGELPATLRELSVGDVADFTAGALPKELTTLALRNVEVVDFRAAPADLEALTLTGRGVTSLDGMPEGVRFVSLQRTFVSSLSPLPASLHALELADNPLLDPLSPGDLPSFLVEIGLEGQDLTELTELPKALRRLRLFNCRGAPALLRSLPSTLTELEIEAARLPGGCWFPDDLRSLTLRGVSGLDVGCLPEHLAELYLQGADAATLNALDRPFERLGIVGPGGAGLSDLGAIPQRLLRLSLDHTQSDLGTLARAAPELTHLRYRGSPLEVLPELPAGLEVLDLGGSDGLRSLGPLRDRNPALRVLVVSGSALASLDEVPPSVRELDVSGTGIRDLEGLPADLVRLTISRGQLESLRGLPASVRHLSIVD